MTIAAHIDDTHPEKISILLNCIRKLAVRYPEHHFIYFLSTHDKSIAENTNCTPVLISPMIKNSLLLHYWYNFKLPSLLIRYNADVFISETGVSSFHTSVPQYMVVKEIDFLLAKVKSKKTIHTLYKRKIFTAVMKKVAGISATSEMITQKLRLEYPLSEKKLQTIYPGINDIFKSLGEQDKDFIRTRYAAGKDFFLFILNSGNTGDTLVVLKAFSHFKKWQKSGMQLVFLTGHNDIERIIKKFKTYKYRDDVKIIPNAREPETAKIIGSAYAVISSENEFDQMDIAIKTMHCEVPVIHLSDHDLYGGAAIHTMRDEKFIAQAMMQVYKDEHLKKKYIAMGKEYVSRYSWDNAATLLWNSIN